MRDFNIREVKTGIDPNLFLLMNDMRGTSIDMFDIVLLSHIICEQNKNWDLYKKDYITDTNYSLAQAFKFSEKEIEMYGEDKIKESIRKLRKEKLIKTEINPKKIYYRRGIIYNHIENYKNIDNTKTMDTTDIKLIKIKDEL